VRMPSVLSPLLRRGERKKKSVPTNLRWLRKLLCIVVQMHASS